MSYDVLRYFLDGISPVGEIAGKREVSDTLWHTVSRHLRNDRQRPYLPSEGL